MPSDDDDDDDGDTTAAAKIVRKGNSRGRRTAKINERWRRQPLGAIRNLQAQNDQKVKSNKRTPSDGSDICVLSKELADNHANATLILNRLKEKERQLESTKKLLLLENDLMEEQLALATKVATLTNVALSAKEEVVTVQRKYETLASEYKNFVATQGKNLPLWKRL